MPFNVIVKPLSYAIYIYNTDFPYKFKSIDTITVLYVISCANLE